MWQYILPCHLMVNLMVAVSYLNTSNCIVECRNMKIMKVLCSVVNGLLDSWLPYGAASINRTVCEPTGQSNSFKIWKSLSKRDFLKSCWVVFIHLLMMMLLLGLKPKYSQIFVAMSETDYRLKMVLYRTRNTNRPTLPRSKPVTQSWCESRRKVLSSLGIAKSSGI